MQLNSYAYPHQIPHNIAASISSECLKNFRSNFTPFPFLQLANGTRRTKWYMPQLQFYRGGDPFFCCFRAQLICAICAICVCIRLLCWNWFVFMGIMSKWHGSVFDYTWKSKANQRHTGKQWFFFSMKCDSRSVCVIHVMKTFGEHTIDRPIIDDDELSYYNFAKICSEPRKRHSGVMSPTEGH